MSREELGTERVGSVHTSLVPRIPEGPPHVPKEIESCHPQLELWFTKRRVSDCLVFTGFQTAPSRYSLLGVASRWANILIEV